MAAAVITCTGYDKARMDDIVLETGLRNGFSHYYFMDKDDISVSGKAPYPFQDIEALEEVLALKGTAATRLEALIQLAMADAARFSKNVALALDFHACAALEGRV
jgi:hypothetical protein